MAERPILFSAPMVRAILEGRKTQTRRLVKQEHFSAEFHARCPAVGVSKALQELPGPPHQRCPYGEPGDRLWVREKIVRSDEPGDDPSWCGSTYDADGAPTKADAWPWKRPWLPPMHCPRGLSRITLRVTSVRVEPLQAITDADAEAEGIEHSANGHPAHIRFAELWDTINGERASWDANPWVWVVGFEREGAL